MGPRSPFRRWLLSVLTVSFGMLALFPRPAAAQVQVTPNFSITPSRETGGWTYFMAIGAIALGVLILIALVAAYLRFAPRFFGREEPAKAPPGVRPPLLAERPATARQQAARQPQALASSTQPPSAPARETPTPSPAPAPPVAGVAATSTGTAVAERADRPPAPAAGEVPPEETERSTAPGRVAAATDTSQEESVAERRSAEAGAVPATRDGATEREEPAAVAMEEPAGEPAAAAGQAATPVPQGQGQAAGASHTAGALDQETFDRVLQEQLAKGMDRRVAEGRARAAAVVAARKKAQG